MEMDETEKRLFSLFCSHYFSEYQHEYKSYEGRQAPLSRFQYVKENYCFLYPIYSYGFTIVVDMFFK